MLGKCDEATCFRRITDAVKLANQQAKFEVSLATMDLCVCDGCVTLPADVGTVLATNNGGFPTLLRDQWFQYHVNGPGTQCTVPWGYTDELGYASTFKDPSGEVLLVAEVENATDSNTTLRVFGWGVDGKRIYTTGAGGVLEDGILVPTVYGFSAPNPDAPAIARIDRVQKDVTNGFIRLIAIDPTDSSSHTLIGYYLPWETTPMYRRIRVPDRSWLRIKYRRTDIEVRSESDWINIENRLALLMLLKSVAFRLNNQTDQANAFESDGMRMLSNEAESLRPPSQMGPQIIYSDGLPAGPSEGLYY